MFKRKIAKNYTDLNGFKIGDKVTLKTIYCQNGENEFTIVSRLKEDSSSYNHSYSLIDINGNQPRQPINPVKNGLEYFNKDHIKKN